MAQTSMTVHALVHLYNKCNCTHLELDWHECGGRDEVDRHARCLLLLLLQRLLLLLLLLQLLVLVPGP